VRVTRTHPPDAPSAGSQQSGKRGKFSTHLCIRNAREEQTPIKSDWNPRSSQELPRFISRLQYTRGCRKPSARRSQTSDLGPQTSDPRSQPSHVQPSEIQPAILFVCHCDPEPSERRNLLFQQHKPTTLRDDSRVRSPKSEVRGLKSEV
jgi:hypothetical protein